MVDDGQFAYRKTMTLRFREQLPINEHRVGGELDFVEHARWTNLNEKFTSRTRTPYSSRTRKFVDRSTGLVAVYQSAEA